MNFPRGLLVFVPFLFTYLPGCASSDGDGGGSSAQDVTAHAPAAGPATPAAPGAGGAPATAGSTAAAPKIEIDARWDFRTGASTDDFARTDLGAAFAGFDAGRLVPNDKQLAFGECSNVDVSTWTSPDQPALVAQCGAAGDFTLYAVAKQKTSLVLLKQELEENGPPGKVETIASVDMGEDFKLVAQREIFLSWLTESASTDDSNPQTKVKLDVSGLVAGQVDFGTVFGNCSEMFPDQTQFKGDKPIINLQCGFAGDFRELGAFKQDDKVVGEVLPLEENGAPGAVETKGSVDIPVDVTPVPPSE